MSEISSILITALMLGSIYGVAALGLVLTYRTSGIFNFAHGGLAMVAGYLLYQLWEVLGVPKYLAAVLVVLVIGPLIGIALYFLVFRSLARASVGMKIVATVALLVSLQGLVRTKFTEPNLRLSSLFPIRGYEFGDVIVGSDQLLIVATVLVVACGLFAFIRFTTMGLAMRGLVDNRDLSTTLGMSVDRLAATSWAIGTGLAFLAGVLLAPLLGTLNTTTLPLIVIQAFAAALFGSLVSLPWALVGAFILALAEQLMIRYGPSGTSSPLAHLANNVAFILLVVLLVVGTPWVARRIREATPEGSSRFGTLTVPRSPWWVGVVVIAVLVLAGVVLDGSWVFALATTAAISIAMLSLVPLTGYSGQISLAQASFCGVGAFSAAYMAGRWGWPAPLAYLLAGFVAVPIGLLVALPAVRFRGIHLALATMGFAVLMDRMVFDSSWTNKGSMPLPRPSILGSTSDRTYYFLSLAVFLVLAWMCINLRGGKTGRGLNALRDSPLGAQSVGVSGARYRFIVFGVSAFIAGIGGAFIGGLFQTAGRDSFSMGQSLVWLTVVVIGGITSTAGACLGAVLLVFVPKFFSSTPRSLNIQQALFGLVAMTVAASPEGIMGNVRRVGQGAASLIRRPRSSAATGSGAILVPAAGGNDESEGASDGVAT